MTKKSAFLISLLLVTAIVEAQKPSEDNQQKLRELALKLDQSYQLEQNKLKEYLEITQGARTDGPSIGIPSGFSPTGRLLYTIDHNESASKATRTTDLYPGGRLATSITGKGMILGVWEISSPDLNHPEFEGRLIIKDGGEAIGDHATHVSGTLIAGGIGANVRGMAYEAILHAYTASGYLSEIAIAAADGLLISSHSYGKSAGWSGGDWLGDPNINDKEDWKFGIYNEEAATLDEIAFLAPYYLLIRSAGNERGEDGPAVYPPDGPYDTMTGEAIAKNILAIGNAIPSVEIPNHKSQIKLRASSSWGPADDGRIKPDLVAPGTNLLSASIDEDGYDLKTGTSMSTPVVAGNAILLQQLHKRLFNSFMKAATLKAVLLHTALDGGHADGPDYEYGYGFLDANLTARTINEKGHLSAIEERTLIDQAGFETQFEVTDTGSPFIASISWTDPAGVAITDAVLDPTDLSLVNDLDVRVTDPDGNTFSPWILNPESPESAATTGDNFRDNYEKIEIENPIAGLYTISVTHKGQLVNGEQEYTILASNLPRQDEAKTFYWVGGSGDWNDPSKWAESSGGSSMDEVPATGARVIFDENSFSSLGTVTLAGNPSLSQLAWFVKNGSVIDFNGNTIDVTHTLHIEGTMAGEGSQINLKPNSALTGSVVQNGQNHGLTLQFEEQEKKFFLTGEDIVLEKIELIDGNLIILNNFSVENLVFGSTNTKQIYLDDLEITTSKLDMGDVALNKVSLENSTLIFEGSMDAHEIRSVGAFELPNIILNSGELLFANDGVINKMNMFAGTSISLEDQIHLEVDDLTIEGTDENRSAISSLGAASLASETSNKFCFDYVDINGVSVSGSTKFVYESNSTLINASGWISAQCEDILFSDFIFRSACAKNTTYFEDLSDGNPETWEWDFGDGSAPSTVQHPIHSYYEPGNYLITLTTTSGLESSTFSKQIEVIASSLIKPVIIYQNGWLSTEAPGPFFQWILDGEPIPGETNRLLSTEIGDGIYQVEAFNEICSVISDPFVPLGIENDIAINYNIYPNPAKEVLHLSSSKSSRDMVVQVVDLGGKLLDQLQIGLVRTGVPVSIPVHHYDPGIYMLHIYISENTFISKKFMLVK